MKVLPICFKQQNQPLQKKRVNYVKLTGYGALASGLACALTAKKRSQHKFFAIGALVLSLAHIGILESYRFRKNG